MKPAIHMCINGKVKVRQSCSLILYINERLRYINPVHVITKTGNCLIFWKKFYDLDSLLKNVRPKAEICVQGVDVP